MKFFSSAINILFITLLTSMIVFPTLYKEVKIVVLGLLVIFIAMNFLKNKNLFINKDIFILFMVTILFSFIFMLNGTLHDTPGATKVITVMIIWPILWFLIIGSIANKSILASINKVFIYSSYFIVVYTLYFVLAQLAIIPNELFFSLYPVEKSGFSNYDGTIETSLLVFASLLFLIPYLIASLFFDTKFNMTKILIIFLSILVLVVSGRRALVLSSLFSFISIFILQFYLKNTTLKNIFKKQKKIFRYMLISIVIILTIVIFDNDIIDITSMIEKFESGFEFTNAMSDGAYERYLQFNALIQGWGNTPLIGSGFGASASVIRSTEQPWAYELSYVALLFHTGLVGVIVYGFATLWIIWQLLLIIRSNNVIFVKTAFPTLVGMISFLIGNATNPYLGKFDFMWVIFVPVLIINLYKLENRKKLEKNI